MKNILNFDAGRLNIIDQVKALSINERQCVAVICLQRYCKKYKIVHSTIDEFIEHIWKVAQINNNFCEWADKFGYLAITGQGDPYPEDLVKAIPVDLIEEFNILTQYVYEISASCWFGSESEDSSKMLLMVFDIISKHNIAIPDLNYYREDVKKNPDGWTPVINDEKLKLWRETV